MQTSQTTLNGTGTPQRPSKVTAERIKLTPKYAETLLGRNEQNRNVSWKYVEQIARDIATGRWTYDGTPIRVARSGRLLDGQHRCHAVIASKKPIDVLLVSGLDESVMDVIDGGRRRTHGDRLTMKGETHALKKAAAATLVRQLHEGDIVVFKSYSFAEIEATLDEHRDAIDWAVTSIPARIEPNIPSGGTYIYGCFAFLYPVNPERAAVLAKRFVSGDGLSQGDPMKALRMVVSSQMTDARESRRDKLFRVLRCLEAGFTGRQLQRAMVDEKVLDRVRALVGTRNR